MRDTTVTTNTNTWSQNLNNKMSTMPGKSDAYKSRQANYSHYSVTEETSQLNMARNNDRSPDSAVTDSAGAILQGCGSSTFGRGTTNDSVLLGNRIKTTQKYRSHAGRWISWKQRSIDPRALNEVTL